MNGGTDEYGNTRGIGELPQQPGVGEVDRRSSQDHVDRSPPRHRPGERFVEMGQSSGAEKTMAALTLFFARSEG